MGVSQDTPMGVCFHCGRDLPATEEFFEMRNGIFKSPCKVCKGVPFMRGGEALSYLNVSYNNFEEKLKEIGLPIIYASASKTGIKAIWVEVCAVKALKNKILKEALAQEKAREEERRKAADENKSGTVVVSTPAHLLTSLDHPPTLIDVMKVVMLIAKRVKAICDELNITVDIQA